MSELVEEEDKDMDPQIIQEEFEENDQANHQKNNSNLQKNISVNDENLLKVKNNVNTIIKFSSKIH